MLHGTCGVSAQAQPLTLQGMKLGLQISSFTWPGGDKAIGPTLARVAQLADEVGFDSIWVMDHFFQIRSISRSDDPMLEGYTALGYLAGVTKRARLGLMVGGIHYRQAGLWLKATTTLDVLSGGRAWFGIGAAWNEEESRGAGLPHAAAGRPLRDARGHAALRACRLERRARHGGAASRERQSRRSAS